MATSMHRRLRSLLSTLLIMAWSAAPLSASPEILRLATTTSTENSGLLAYLLPEFERQSDLKVHVIAVGTGKALRIASQGDADVVLVHAPPAEEQFVANGYGVDRLSLMYNDFVIVGRPEDAAGIGATKRVKHAFRLIAESGSRFVSRGDDSGTHQKELQIWDLAGLRPAGEWYIESGQGMGKVLLMASELDAYTMTDRGTWLFMRDKLALALLFENDPPLFNPYSIIAVNPNRHPDVNYRGATALIEWLASAEGQGQIAAYQVKGQRLFFPLVVPAE